MIECLFGDLAELVRERHGGQSITVIEGPISDLFHRGRHTVAAGVTAGAANQRAFSLVIQSAIAVRSEIFTFVSHRDPLKGGTVREHIFSNGTDSVSKYHTFQLITGSKRATMDIIQRVGHFESSRIGIGADVQCRQIRIIQRSRVICCEVRASTLYRKFLQLWAAGKSTYGIGFQRFWQIYRSQIGMERQNFGADMGNAVIDRDGLDLICVGIPGFYRIDQLQRS